MSTSDGPNTPLNTSECALCYEPYSPSHRAAKLPNCRHVFGLECIEKWVNSDNAQRNRCPECRALIIAEAPQLVQQPVYNPQQVHPHQRAMYCNMRALPRDSLESFSEEDELWFPEGLLGEEAMAEIREQIRHVMRGVQEADGEPREQRRGLLSRVRDVFRRGEAEREVGACQARGRQDNRPTTGTSTSTRHFEVNVLNFERREGGRGGSEYSFSLALGA